MTHTNGEMLIGAVVWLLLPTTVLYMQTLGGLSYETAVLLLLMIVIYNQYILYRRSD